MNRTKASPAVPLRIRDACMHGLETAIPEIVKIACEGESQSLKLSAFDKLGKIGLGGRKTVLVEGPQLAELCLELVKEMFSPTQAQLTALAERIGGEVAALGGDEIEEDDEGDPEE